MNRKLSEWVNHTPERVACYAQEALIVDVTEEICRVMHERIFAKTDLAAGLNCSKAHVTQLLNGQRNLTLRTLADICRVLGVKASITLNPADSAAADK